MIENITKSHPNCLEKGEQVWRLDSGRTFTVLIVKDHVTSHQGNECFRLIATELDAYGFPAIRSDGKLARDDIGHYVSHMSHGDGDVRSTLLGAIETYLEMMDRASQAHADLVELDDWIVGHDEAAYLPVNTPHLRPSNK